MNCRFDKLTDDEMLIEVQRKLRKIMAIKKVNQKRLSEETGISQSLISRYMNGKAVPSILNVMKIAKVLECSLDDLMHIW